MYVHVLYVHTLHVPRLDVRQIVLTLCVWMYLTSSQAMRSCYCSLYLIIVFRIVIRVLQETIARCTIDSSDLALIPPLQSA